MLLKLIATPLQLFLTVGHLRSHILIYIHGNVTNMIDIIIALVVCTILQAAAKVHKNNSTTDPESMELVMTSLSFDLVRYT